MNNMKETHFNSKSIYNGDVCSMCGKSGDLPHPDCENEARLLAIENRTKMIEMANKYGIGKTFGPSNLDSRMDLNEAINVLAQYLDHKPTFEIDQVLENENWFFIPHGWIGVLGFIVEKESKKVFCLGSGLRTAWNAIESYVDGKVDPIGKES